MEACLNSKTTLAPPFPRSSPAPARGCEMTAVAVDPRYSSARHVKLQLLSAWAAAQGGPMRRSAEVTRAEALTMRVSPASFQRGSLCPTLSTLEKSDTRAGSSPWASCRERSDRASGGLGCGVWTRCSPGVQRQYRFVIPLNFESVSRRWTIESSNVRARVLRLSRMFTRS